MGTRVKCSYLGGLRYYDLCRDDRIFLKVYPHNDILKTSVILSELLLDLNAKWTTIDDFDVILLSPASIFNPENHKLRDGLADISSFNPLSFYPVLLDESGVCTNIGPGCLPENYILSGNDGMMAGSNLGSRRLMPGTKTILEYYKFIKTAASSDATIEIAYLYHIGAFDEFPRDIRDEIWDTLRERIGRGGGGNYFRGKSFKFLY